jgi:ABC-type glycerol-3-phosphate transport system substrate-binding protein
MRTLLYTTVAGICLGGMASAQAVTLQFWDNQQTESGLSQYQQEAVERFRRRTPTIRVEVTTIPYPEYQQRLLTAVQGGNAPDVVDARPDLDRRLRRGRRHRPLDRHGRRGRPRRGDLLRRRLGQRQSYNGRLWGIPFNVDVWSFSFYNADLLNARPGSIRQRPVDLRGLRRAAEKLTGDGRYGVGLFGHRGEDTVVVLNSFIFSNGGEVLDEDGACALDER